MSKQGHKRILCPSCDHIEQSKKTKFIDPVRVLPACQEEFDGHLANDKLYKILQVCKSTNVLIIENNFDGMANPLLGYKVDAERLQRMWEQMGCKVRKLTNLKMQEMLDAISKFAQSKEHQDNDYAVLVILSHGNMYNDQDVCFGVDDQYFNTTELVEMFDGDFARHLVGKPKLILLQFCKGVAPLPEVAIQEKENQVVASHIRLAAKLDTMIVHATHRGHPAFVNPNEGSLLIRNLVDVFSENAKDTHVADMMIKVRAKVSEEKVSGSKKIYTGSKQACFVEDSTTKKFFLFPKVDRSDRPGSF